MPKHKPDTAKPPLLTPKELDDLNILCDLANKPISKQQQLADKSGDSPKPPLLRLQNLALPMRVRACRAVLAMADGVHYQDALAQAGITHLEFYAIRHKDHDFALVWEAAKRASADLTAAKAKKGLDRLVSEDGCALNAKAVMFAAERLDPQQFGRASEDGGEGGRGGAKTVYNIVINAQSGPTPCGNLAANPIEAEVINENPHE